MDDKRKYVLKQLEKEKLIAIIRNIKIAEFLDVIEELREGGINCVEISANTTNYADIVSCFRHQSYQSLQQASYCVGSRCDDSDRDI